MSVEEWLRSVLLILVAAEDVEDECVLVIECTCRGVSEDDRDISAPSDTEADPDAEVVSGSTESESVTAGNGGGRSVEALSPVDPLDATVETELECRAPKTWDEVEFEEVLGFRLSKMEKGGSMPPDVTEEVSGLADGSEEDA